MQNSRRYRRSERKKRAGAPLGFLNTYLYKPLFGIMGEEDADMINKKINELAANQETHHTILEQNLSIINKLKDTVNDTMSEFKKNMEEMNAFIARTAEKLKEMEINLHLHLEFTYISSLITNIKIEYNKAITIIKRVIQNKLVGEYTEIMIYKRLTKDLQTIEQDFDDTRVKLLTINPRIKKLHKN